MKEEAMEVESPQELAELLEKTFAGDVEEGNWLRVAEYIFKVRENASKLKLGDGFVERTWPLGEW